MKIAKYKFSNSVVEYYFSAAFAQLKKIVDKKSTVIITDENVFFNHSKRFQGWNVIVIKAGEQYKIQETVDSIIEQLLGMGIDRSSTLVGAGGGVVTDLTGYVASIYMRGVRFGFVPTTVLAMVDASIGGKNGIDVGLYKNMVGVIRQPAFIFFDSSFLDTLPEKEWVNGFAEIIKHACVRDATMFRELEKTSLSNYRKRSAIAKLVERNAILKTRIVQIDEFEKKERRLLNFGHTLGHALENQYELSHGQAISIGMAYAAKVSEQLIGFKEANRLIDILEKYGLPANMDFDHHEVMDVLKMDKKKVRNEINYILLQSIGRSVIYKIPLDKLDKLIRKVSG